MIATPNTQTAPAGQNSRTPTRAEISAALVLLKAIADTIRELHQVAASELYAAVMHRVSFEEFTRIVSILTRAGIVDETAHLLTWKAPAAPVARNPL